MFGFHRFVLSFPSLFSTGAVLVGKVADAAAVVDVWVQRGIKLESMDIVTATDPFVNVNINKKFVYRTAMIADNYDPVWTATQGQKTGVALPSTGTIGFELRDQDPLTSEPLGWVIIDVEKLIKEDPSYIGVQKYRVTHADGVTPCKTGHLVINITAVMAPTAEPTEVPQPTEPVPPMPTTTPVPTSDTPAPTKETTPAPTSDKGQSPAPTPLGQTPVPTPSSPSPTVTPPPTLPPIPAPTHNATPFVHPHTSSELVKKDVVIAIVAAVVALLTLSVIIAVMTVRRRRQRANQPRVQFNTIFDHEMVNVEPLFPSDHDCMNEGAQLHHESHTSDASLIEIDIHPLHYVYSDDMPPSHVNSELGGGLIVNPASEANTGLGNTDGL